MNRKELMVSKLQFLTVLPPTALYLAGAEVFIDYSVVLSRELLRESLKSQVEKTVPMVIINMSVGFVYALILSFVLDINWAAVILVIMTIFAALVAEWSKEETISVERLTTAFALSWILSAAQPLRLAFMAEQVPSNLKPVYSRRYFAFIAACDLFSQSGYWIYVFLGDSDTTVRHSSIMFFCLMLMYSGLFIYLEFSTKYKRKYFEAPKVIVRVSHERGQKQWDLYHIAMTLTAHTFATLITATARNDQYRALAAEYDIFLGGYHDMITFGAFPGFVGILMIVIALIGVEPVLKRFGVEVTDFRYIGVGMICGCISLTFTTIMQRSLDAALRPPNSNEGFLLIFNTLPSSTSFRSGLFDKNEMTWLQVPPRSETNFYVSDIIGKRQYPVSITNPDHDFWDEDFIELEDGKVSTYVIADRKLIKVKGLDITHDSFLNKGKIYVGCTMRICVGNLYFHQGDNIEVVSIPENDRFTTHHLKQGSHKITTFVLTEREYTVAENFTIRNSDVVAGMVVDDEGDVNLLPYTIRHPSTIPLFLVVLQDIFVALRDGMFGLGLLRFLFSQTRPGCPSRQFTYSAFFLLFRGLPWMIFGGILVRVSTFDSFLINVFLLYYGCCTALFVHSAYKYKHKWAVMERE